MPASSEIVARIGAVGEFVAGGNSRDDVALECRLQQRPLEPGGVAQMAARHGAVAPDPQPGEDVAAETLDESHAFAGTALRQIRADRTRGQAIENLIDEIHALPDLAHAEPHAPVDAAV